MWDFSFLHTRLRTATLRHDADGQAVLVNLLLRNYLHFNLYDQAEKLVSKSVFPELANNNEWARYLYYTGESTPVLQCRCRGKEEVPGVFTHLPCHVTHRSY